MDKNELVAKIKAIAPLIITLLALINSFLTLKGLPSLEIGDQAITNTINTIADIVGIIWCWWKNNNFTVKAQVTQPVLNLLKKNRLTTGQVRQFIDVNS